MANWRPHGLISLEELERPYENVKIVNAGGVIIQDPKEHHTTNLWEDLAREMFPERGYKINSQAPPTETSDRKCDSTVKVVTATLDRQIICHVELKRANEFTPAGKRRAENQLLQRYCAPYLADPDNQHLQCVFGITMIGRFVCCWVFYRNANVLTPLWTDIRPNAEQYKDVGEDSSLPFLVPAIQRIKTTNIGTQVIGSQYLPSQANGLLQAENILTITAIGRQGGAHDFYRCEHPSWADPNWQGPSVAALFRHNFSVARVTDPLGVIHYVWRTFYCGQFWWTRDLP